MIYSHRITGAWIRPQWVGLKPGQSKPIAGETRGIVLKYSDSGDCGSSGNASRGYALRGHALRGCACEKGKPRFGQPSLKRISSGELIYKAGQTGDRASSGASMHKMAAGCFVEKRGRGVKFFDRFFFICFSAKFFDRGSKLRAIGAIASALFERLTHAFDARFVIRQLIPFQTRFLI